MPHMSQAKSIVWGRPKVAYMTGIGEAAVSRTTPRRGRVAGERADEQRDRR